MNMAHYLFNREKQSRLLHNVLRLAKANLHQKAIAEQLVRFGNKTEKAIGQDVLDAIEDGKTFSVGIKSWLDPLAWEALLAGEKTGNWAKGLRNALISLDVNQQAGGKLLKALLQPLTGLLVLLGASSAANLFLFPMLENLYPPHRWGAWSQLANRFGAFWTDWGGGLAVALALIVGAVFVSLPLWSGSSRAIVDNWPVYRQYRLIQVSSVLRSLGNLTLAGFGLKEAVENCEKTANPYLRSHLATIQTNMTRGIKNIGDLMDTGLLNPAEQHSLKILGDIGSYSETLSNSANIHQDILLNEVELVRILGANILKLTGLAIGLIMGGGILLLITDIASNIKV